MPTFDDIENIYKKLIGYMPPRMKDRVKRGLRLDPDFTSKVEQLRDHAVAPKALELKTSQLIAFGILLNNLSHAAVNHGCAALRAGATEEELHAVAEMAFLFRGLPALNFAEEAIAGALEAYAKHK
jgi:alkylhydroperoxidase/carboxymuconolactone decarboxylase family protein YurZ